MAVCIIVAKAGERIEYRSSELPNAEAKENAKRLDAYLQREVPKIEAEVVAAKLVEGHGLSEGKPMPKGSVELWHAVGSRLAAVCRKHMISNDKERRWLWQAVQMYAPPRISRADRGKTRNHFEYCYRVAQFPLEFAEQIKWSEWVYFFDSRTVREESRVQDWLKTLVDRDEELTREAFRSFSERLNRRVKNLDTSVLSKKELFALYDETWKEGK